MTQQPELQAEVRPLFPTPVATARLPGAEAVNAALKELILAREQSHPSTQHSNLGGWQSPLDLPQWGGPMVAKLQSLYADWIERDCQS